MPLRKGHDQLSTQKGVMILTMRVWDMSMHPISRTVGVLVNTVTRLMVDAGEPCAEYHDKTVMDVRTKRVRRNGIWSFCNARGKNEAKAIAAPDGIGDVWTWMTLDRDSKMKLSREVGDRSGSTAIKFMDDPRSRLANRVKLTTDGHKA